jgi:hypothetical protein
MTARVLVEIIKEIFLLNAFDLTIRIETRCSCFMSYVQVCVGNIIYMYIKNIKEHFMYCALDTFFNGQQFVQTEEIFKIFKPLVVPARKYKPLVAVSWTYSRLLWRKNITTALSWKWV